jgi:hypothetical protein
MTGEHKVLPLTLSPRNAILITDYITRRPHMAGNFNPNEYATVNERIAKFKAEYPEGSIQTEIVKYENGLIVVKAYAFRDREDIHPSTGHAQEVEGSSYINKTSALENCETSAVGRALAFLGFEVKKAIASREEVEKARRREEALKQSGDRTDKTITGLDRSTPQAYQKPEFDPVLTSQANGLYLKLGAKTKEEQNALKKEFGETITPENLAKYVEFLDGKVKK